MSTLGARTTLLRKSLGLTQKEFAVTGDFSQSNLSLMENDGVVPNLGFFVRITAKFPDINLNWWINGHEEMFLSKTSDMEVGEGLDPSLKKFLKDLRKEVSDLSMSNRIILGRKKKSS